MTVYWSESGSVVLVKGQFLLVDHKVIYPFCTNCIGYTKNFCQFYKG